MIPVGSAKAGPSAPPAGAIVAPFSASGEERCDDILIKGESMAELSSPAFLKLLRTLSPQKRWHRFHSHHLQQHLQAATR